MQTGFQLGPFTIHYYGVIILAGVAAALVLTSREAARRGKSIDFLLDGLPWFFLGAVLGARIWHIFTPPQSMVARGITTRYYLTHLLEALAIWKGGIGIIGAVFGGALALWLYARRKGVSAAIWLDILSPGLALAQACGRWGNYINQEVFGLPSNLPWAIYIDPQHRLPGYSQVPTYHPLFLYESLWSLLNMAFLLWISRKLSDRLKPGSLFLIYLVFYGVGRVGLEFLRLDVSAWGGVNLNQTAMSLVVISALILLYNRQRASSEPLKDA
jgi:phosphatidylglycerol:prolipoprotein diacylglycerol transferase